MEDILKYILRGASLLERWFRGDPEEQAAAQAEAKAANAEADAHKARALSEQERLRKETDDAINKPDAG